MGDPGGRIGRRPGGLGCGSRFRRGIPGGTGACRVRARWMIRDRRPCSGFQSCPSRRSWTVTSVPSPAPADFSRGD